MNINVQAKVSMGERKLNEIPNNLDHGKEKDKETGRGMNHNRDKSIDEIYMNSPNKNESKNALLGDKTNLETNIPMLSACKKINKIKWKVLGGETKKGKNEPNEESDKQFTDEKEGTREKIGRDKSLSSDSSDSEEGKK